jgi:hypothetical protein
VNILLADVGLILWFALLIFQLSDLAASILDIRNAPFANEGGHVRRRYATTFWLLPLSIATGIVIVIGVEVAGWMIQVMSLPVPGLLVLLGLVAVAVGIVIGIIAALSPRSIASYSSLRLAAMAVGTRRTTKKQVELLRLQLAEVDQRKRDLRIGTRDSKGQRQLRRDVDARVREFRVMPPSGLSAIGSIRWRMAARFLAGSSTWRLVPVVVGLLLIAAVVVWGSGFVQLAGLPLAVILAVPVLVSLIIALLSAKASLAAKATWHAVEQAERTELEQLIANLERTSRRGVAGLGERVARALQILREQQG